MIEDHLSQIGLLPDIDDEALGAAYESCPPVQKSVIKNAVSFAYALAQRNVETLGITEQFSHVQRATSMQRLDWAFFAVDERVFPLPAVFAAMVQALVAKVDTLVVHVSGPVSEAFLFGCDLLSVQQIFTRSVDDVLDALENTGRGVVVDLAGLARSIPGMIRPAPADYGVRLQMQDSEYVQAYRAVTTHWIGDERRPYIAYGGADAPVVMAEHLLGCWIWDCITPDSFRFFSSTFS